MPIRFLLMGDRHNSEHIPASRIDNFHESVKAKDEEILSIAKKYNVSAIIHAGDFWTDGDAKIKNDFIPEIIKRWVDPLNPTKSIPMIGIAGNHDLVGNNIHSLPNTTLGLTAALGYQRIATKEEPIVFTMENGKTVAITGTNFHIHMDEPEYINDYIVDKKAGDYHIHLVHGMLSPKNLGKMMKHTVIDDIKNTAADVTFCGHDHLGFDTVFMNDKYFVNPGAIVRLKNDKKELTRKIKVILLTIDDSGISLEDIYLSSVKDASVALSRDVIERKKKKEEASEQIKKQIELLTTNKKTKFSEILADTFKTEEVSSEIMSDLQKRISDKEIKTNAGLTVPKDTHIVSIEIKNFQSHEDTLINFDKGFNVLLGESRQGKTAVLRALRWVLENKPQGKAIIRNGADKASVTLRLGNGTYIERFMCRDERKGNGYKIILPDGTIQEGNTRLVGVVQSICGFNHMDTDENKKLPINFLRQGEGWFLIDENVSATDRARIIGAIQNTQAADAVVKDLDKDNSQINTLIKKNNAEVNKTWDEINKLNVEKERLEKIKRLLELQLLKEKIEEYFVLKKEFDASVAFEEEISNAYTSICEANIVQRIRRMQEKQSIITEECEKVVMETKRLGICNSTIQQCSNTEHSLQLLSKLSSKVLDYSDIHSSIETLSKENRRQKEIDNMMSLLSGCRDDIPNVLRKLIDKRGEIENAATVYKKQGIAMRAAEQFINASDITIASEGKIQQVIKLLEKSDVINSSVCLITKEQKNVSCANKTIKDSEQKINEYNEAKSKVLKDAKVCPICSQIIPDNIGGHVHE